MSAQGSKPVQIEPDNIDGWQDKSWLNAPIIKIRLLQESLSKQEGCVIYNAHPNLKRKNHKSSCKHISLELSREHISYHGVRQMIGVEFVGIYGLV